MRLKTIKVFGVDMHVDDGDILNLSSTGVYEPVETKFVRELIKPDMIVLDIGAHIGYYTCMFSQLVGPKGKVYAFEPNVENYQTNLTNQRINNLTNIEIVNAGASNQRGVGKMYTCAGNSGDHRTFFSNAEPNRPSYEIPLIKIDDFTAEKNIMDKIDFVKMDVQGYETFVLQGMTETLQKSKNIVVLTEFWPFGVKQAGLTSKQFLDVCLDLGFKYVVMNNNGVYNDFSVDKLLAQSQDNPNWGVNLIWKKV